MTVREDQVLRADGTPGAYGVVEKPDFVVVAAVDSGKLYLVEQYRYPVGDRFWELPQGSWEQGDADPLELARGELREETGLEACSMVQAGHLFLAYGYSNQGYHIFLASDLTQLAPQREPEEQGLIAKPFPITEVEGMIRSGEIKDATTIAAFGLLRLKGLL